MNLLPWPKEWVGTDALAAWMKRLLNRCKQEVLLDSDDFRRIQTNNGYFIEAKAKPSSGGKDVVNNGGYLGEYDPAKKYEAGSIVRKTSGTTTGVFAVRPGSTANVGVQPTFPENPAGPWDFIAFIPQVVGVCSNGQKLIYVQSSLPF